MWLLCQCGLELPSHGSPLARISGSRAGRRCPGASLASNRVRYDNEVEAARREVLGVPRGQSQTVEGCRGRLDRVGKPQPEPSPELRGQIGDWSVDHDQRKGVEQHPNGSRLGGVDSGKHLRTADRRHISPVRGSRETAIREAASGLAIRPVSPRTDRGGPGCSSTALALSWSRRPTRSRSPHQSSRG